jgi:hypothetical protein
MKEIYIGKSEIHGKGLFAGEPIKRGERIQYINGKKEKKVPKSASDSKAIGNWIGMGKFTWINTKNTPFRFINHSCDPNAAISGIKTVVAMRDIAKDEEIAIDYSMTDADQHWSIACDCGSKDCRKIIRAIYTVPPQVFEKHMPYIPRFFQRVYLRTYIKKQMSDKK